MRFRKISTLCVALISVSCLHSESLNAAADATQRLFDALDNERGAKAASRQREAAKEFERRVEHFNAEDIGEGPYVMYTDTSDSRPAVGTFNKAYMGDRMLLQRVGFFADCLIPKFSLPEKKRAAWHYKMKANVPLCKTKAKDKRFGSSYINAILHKGKRIEENHYIDVELNYSKRKKTNRICLIHIGMKAYCSDDLSEDRYHLGPAFVSIENSLQKTIEYAGKRGEIISFIYSEFSDRMARDAFTREFSVDLSEGNVAAYKGAVFEIVEANNAEITYKVIRHFPGT